MSYTITITIDTDSAAFDDGECSETKRILVDVPKQIEGGIPIRDALNGMVLFDHNGKIVGSVAVIQW